MSGYNRDQMVISFGGLYVKGQARLLIIILFRHSRSILLDLEQLVPVWRESCCFCVAFGMPYGFDKLLSIGCEGPHNAVAFGYLLALAMVRITCTIAVCGYKLGFEKGHD